MRVREEQMVTSGYIVTPATQNETGRQFAFGLLGGLGCRYVGLSDDGACLAAFDVPYRTDAYRFTEFGRVYMLTGIGNPMCPKRTEARGDERFILLRPTKHSANELHEAVAPQARASAVVHSDGESCVLVELGASDPFIADAAVVWDHVITEFVDSRLVAV